MNNLAIQQDRLPFSFRAIFFGREVSIAIAWNEGHTCVFLDNEFVARLAIDEDRQSWFVAAGELNDPDLVNEIGLRIWDRHN